MHANAHSLNRLLLKFSRILIWRIHIFEAGNLFDNLKNNFTLCEKPNLTKSFLFLYIAKYCTYNVKDVVSYLG